jgi:hypothetical protein
MGMELPFGDEILHLGTLSFSPTSHPRHYTRNNEKMGFISNRDIVSS